MKHLKVILVLTMTLSMIGVHAQNKKTTESDATEWGKAKHKSIEKNKSLDKAQEEAFKAQRIELRQQIKSVQNDATLSQEVKNEKIKLLMVEMAESRATTRSNRISKAEQHIENRRQERLSELSQRDDLSAEEKEKRIAKINMQHDKKTMHTQHKAQRAEVKSQKRQAKTLMHTERKALEVEWDALSDIEREERKEEFRLKRKELKKQQQHERSSQMQIRLEKMTKDLRQMKESGQINDEQYRKKMKHIEKMKARSADRL